MSKVLDETFVANIKELMLQVDNGMGLKQSFITTEDPEELDNHLYKRILVIRSYLGDEDISPEEAEKLVKTDLVDCVFVGTEGEGYNNDVDEDWTKENLAFGEECKLWV